MMYEENSSSLTQEVEEEEEVKMSQESIALMQKQQQMEAELQMARKSMNDEEFKQHQKPKEITVVAGDGKHVKIQLGGDQNEDSRKQVAEAAGLKHVPLPDFDDSDVSAWAGSLKKTAKVKTLTGREEPDSDQSPWAGSLRHVKDKPRRSQKHDERDEDKSSAPWMGTLRHVVHDNKVTRNYGVT